MSKILVAEDNEVNQQLIRLILDKSGFEYKIVTDGQTALNEYCGGQYQLILMDCQMPGMDGFRASTEIRKFETETKRSRTPIIALTANAMKGDRERCLQAGMDDFLSKPFKMKDLVGKLQQWKQGVAS